MTRLNRLILACLVVVLASPCGSSSQVHKKLYPPAEVKTSADSNFSLVGSWLWGQCTVVASYNEYIIVNNGGLLQFLTWNPRSGSPTIIAEYEIGSIYAIHVRDTLAYVNAGASFLILDIHDPLHVELLGAVNLSDLLGSLEITDSIAFVTEFLGAFDLIDISNNAHPFVRSRFGAGPLFPRIIATNQGYCYVANYDYPLLNVYDGHNPDSLKYVGQMGTGFVDAGFVSDTLLMLHQWGMPSIMAYSISTPSNPVYLYDVSLSTTVPGWVAKFIISGPHVYAVSDSGGVYDFTYADSLHLTLAAHGDLPFITSKGVAMTESGDGVLYAAGTNALASYDAMDSLRYLGSFPTAGLIITGISLRGDLAGVAAYDGGVWLLDISNLNNPRQVSNINNGGLTQCAIIRGNRLTIYDQSAQGGSGTLYFYDISDSTHPRLASSISTAPRPSRVVDVNRMVIDKNLLFLTDPHPPDSVQTGIEILDVTDSARPQRLIGLSTDYTIMSVAAGDSMLYVGARDSGLYVYNYRSLPALSLVTHIQHGCPESFSALTLDDSVLFAYSTVRGIWVYSVIHPGYLDTVSVFPPVLNIYQTDMAISNHFLYTQGIRGDYDDESIEAIDIADLHHIVDRGFFTSFTVGPITARDKYVFLAPGFGIEIASNDLMTGVKYPNAPIMPSRYRLDQNYPNPFNPTTTVSFVISHPSFVTLVVYDVLGRVVSTLVNEVKQPGEYTVKWNTEGIASGVYFYRLQAGNPSASSGHGFTDVKKMLILK